MSQSPSKPSIHMIAGPNGAGKTTFARDFLPEFAPCKEFVNADLIAQGLSPFAPEGASLAAGRLMLGRLEELGRRRETFAFETTLAGRGYVPWLRHMRKEGYIVRLYFLWLPTVDIALSRVANRVKLGGHFVPEDDVRRRFTRGIRNLFHLYRTEVDSWILIENTKRTPCIIAFEEQGLVQIVEPARFALAQETGNVTP